MSRVIEENGRRSTEKELWSDKKRTIFHLQNIHLQIRDLLLKADF